MHLAAMHRKTDVINALYKKYGGSIDIRDNSGRKPSWYMPDHPIWASRVMQHYDSRNSSSSSASSTEHVFVTTNPFNERTNGCAKGQANDGQFDRFEKGVRRTMLSMAQSFRTKGRRRRQQPTTEAKETKNTEFRARASTEASHSPRPRHLKSFSAPSTPRTRHISIEHPHMGEKEGVVGSYHLDPKFSPSPDRNRRISEQSKTYPNNEARHSPQTNRAKVKSNGRHDESADLKTKRISDKRENGTLNNNIIKYQSDIGLLNGSNHRLPNENYGSNPKYSPSASGLSDSQNNWKSTTFV